MISAIPALLIFVFFTAWLYTAAGEGFRSSFHVAARLAAGCSWARSRP